LFSQNTRKILYQDQELKIIAVATEVRKNLGPGLLLQKGFDDAY